jgi:hypothetical protein
MKRLILVFITVLLIQNIRAQNVDPLLLEIRQQMELIAEARAAAELILDVDFIKMPVKYAEIHYKRDQPVSYTSDNFIIIPKKGLDFSWSELFRHDFMTVDRGVESVAGKALKVLNIIPLDKKADFAIMTLKLDTVLMHIREAEITTKNEGSYRLLLSYTGSSAFPDQVVVEFELERIKIPLSFMGKDTEIDKTHLKSDELKKGSITLNLVWQEILIEE